MEEKESTVSGSPGNSDTDSPTPVSSTVVVPQLMNMNMNVGAVNLGLERSISATPTPTPTPTQTAPIIGSSGGLLSGGQVIGGTSVDLFGKKKRGRPRKYDSDGNLRVQPFYRTAPPVGVVTSPPPSCFSFSPPPPSDSSKRGRGRPPGSGNWQLLASLGEMFANTAGGDFTPHVVTVNTGEDVAGKILSFSQKGPRGICVLSANGAVSNVTIRQPGSSGGILTYEGRFEILSLTGSFTVTETGGVRSRTGGLSVSLAGPDGRVIGGGVAGLLLAASPIQIVVGSFMPNGYKAHKRKHHREHTMASVVPGAPDIVTTARPISQAKLDGEPATMGVTNIPQPACQISPGQSHRGTDSSTHDKQISNAMHSSSACWNGTEHTSNQRPSPDINISVPSEEDVQGVA